MKSLFLGSLLFSLSLLGIWLLPGQEKPTRSTAKSSQPKPPAKIGNPSFLSPHFRPITLHRDHLFLELLHRSSFHQDLQAHFFLGHHRPSFLQHQVLLVHFQGLRHPSFLLVRQVHHLFRPSFLLVLQAHHLNHHRVHLSTHSLLLASSSHHHQLCLDHHLVHH